MNKPVLPKDLPKGSPQAVTTGPIMGSRKVYAAVAGHDDIRVPFREVTLSDPKEAPVRVYDPSGPYTQTDAAIDLNAGLPLIRDPWIAKRGYATVTPRGIRRRPCRPGTRRHRRRSHDRRHRSRPCGRRRRHGTRRRRGRRRMRE